MPEPFQERQDIFQLQRQQLELKQKLKLEQNMLDASIRIQASMNTKQTAQQLQNSVRDAEDRIQFLQAQITEVEQHLQQVNEERRDLPATIKKAASQEYLTQPKLRKVLTNEMDFWRAGASLSAEKVEYKVRELGCRLKIQENIMSASDRMIEAWQTHGSSTGQEPTAAIKKLQEARELTKQKISLLTLALKKYTSLAFSEFAVGETAGSSSELFSGKLLIKVSQLNNLNATSRAPFSFEFFFDQLSPFSRSDPTQQGASFVLPVSNPSVSNNSTEFYFYQELSTNLQQASEIQVTLRSGASQQVHGMFFMKLAALLPCGPEQEWKLSEELEFEPVGTFSLQVYYHPDTKSRQQQQAANRIQRKPAFKRTQHQILGHQLVSTNFFQLLKCSYCEELIINSSGYQCSRKLKKRNFKDDFL
jgi:hypothetical protein